MPSYLVANCRVRLPRVLRRVLKRLPEARVNDGGSSCDSLKVAKCLVISLVTRLSGFPNVPIYFQAKARAFRRYSAKSRQCQAGSLTGAVLLSKGNAGVLR
jgi:hypothetical protein